MTIAPTGSGTQMPSQSMQQLTGNFDTFLQLLTTQMRNQDPLSPMDSTQFTQQLVAFSQVEQQINTNANLNNLIQLTEANAGSAAVSYLGKTVTVTNGNAALQNGSATWNYTLGADAASTTLTVTNSSGQVVYSGPGETSSGSNTFDWNGQDSSGNQLPDGVYTLSVSATASDGSAITSSVSSTGTVTEISFQNGVPVLMVGPMAVQLSQISQVGEVTS